VRIIGGVDGILHAVHRLYVIEASFGGNNETE
jgi:hypothetical protein